MEEAMIDRQDGRLAFALFVLLCGVYLLSFSGRYHASDEMSMLAATDSLARRGAWDTELIRWMGEQQGSFGPDGHLYSRKGIGTTLAALPLYALALLSERLGNVQAAMLTGAWVTAWTGALVFLYIRRLGYGPGVSAGTAAAFGLATMAWPYARTLFSEPLAGLGLMLAAYYLLRYRDRGDALSPVLAGAGLGIAMLARLNNAIAAPFLGLVLLAYVSRRSGRPRRDNWRAWAGVVALFAAPVLAALAVTAWYNALRFGSPFVTGYLPEERFSAPFFQGLYGLTFSPGKGLLWYNPLLFAAAAAWPAFARRHRPEGLLAAAVVLSSIAFYAPWYLWWGGHGWGPRFLAAVLPFAALPLAAALEFARRRRLVAAGLALLGAASLAVQLPGVALNFNQYLDDIYGQLGLYHPATLFNPAYSPLVRSWAYLRAPNLDLAWARGGVDGPALAAGIGVVVLAALGVWSAWPRSPAPPSLPRSLPWTALAAALAAGAVFSLARYAPAGDVAQAAHLVAAMEGPGEAVELAGPLTGPFQDAYDGRLPVWGVIEAERDKVWVLGAGDETPAAARFRVGNLPLALRLPAGDYFDVARLPFAAAAGPRLGDRIELAAVQVGASEVRRGEALSVALLWRALAPIDTSYTVFVQLVDEGGAKAGQIDRLPCDGSCPTTNWRPGDVAGDWMQLPVPATAAPGRYRAIAGLYDLATGERLPVRDAAGSPAGDLIVLGLVQVRP